MYWRTTKEEEKAGGRPVSISVRSAIAHTHSIAPASLFSPDTSSCIASPSECSTDLTCRLCRRLLDRPVYLITWTNLVCMRCLCERLEESGHLICPCCDCDHMKEFTTIVHPSAVVISALGNFKVKCTLCNNDIASGTFTKNIYLTNTYTIMYTQLTSSATAILSAQKVYHSQYHHLPVCKTSC